MEEWHRPSMESIESNFAWTLHQHVTRALPGLLPDAIKPHKLKHVLDVYCRSGSWAIDCALSYPGIQITGIDTSAQHIEVACQIARGIGLAQLHFQAAELTQPLAFQDETFDLLHLFTTAPLLRPDEWQVFLRECWRVLTPGGRINLVYLSHGPGTGAAHQRCLLMLDQYWQQQGYVFAAMPAGSTPGLHFCSMLRQNNFADVTYNLYPINFGGSGNGSGRACSQFFLQRLRQMKSTILASGVIHEDEFDRILVQRQQEIISPSYCATGVIISALGTKR